MDPLTTMISYSWDDSDAAELLHVELALRGFDVIHDRCTFALGSRIPQNMADAVATCDAFVAYLTPSSLYLGKPDNSSRPALDNEFLPILKRWREASAAERAGGPPAPVVVPLTHGVGHPRSEAPEKVFQATGESITTLWAPVELDQSTAGITREEAASVAASLIRRVLAVHLKSTSADCLPVALTTRGQGQQAEYLSVDGTSILGGATSRPGGPDDWSRLLSGLRDLESALSQATRLRSLLIRPRAHLTACLAFGRVFNQAAGWNLVVEGRHGETSLRHAGTSAGISVAVDRAGGPGAMTVEIDMLGTNLRELATDVIRQAGEEPSARVQLSRQSRAEMEPDDVSAAALTCIQQIRDVAAELKPRLTRVFCAAAAELAVLVGHRLTSLHCDLQLYERDGDRYVPSLLISRSIP